MSVSLKQNLIIADEKSLMSGTHVLLVLPMTRPKNLPFSEALDAKLKRTNKKYSDLLKTALITDLPNGSFASWIVLDNDLSAFKRHTLLRKAVKPLLDENPAALTIAVYGADADRHR